MNHMKVKLLIAGLLVGVALTYLAYAGVQKGWVYYLQVDQFTQDTQYHSQRVRLCGKVGTENVVAQPAQLTATFSLMGDSSQVPVVYRGVIPDLFKPGCEVVVEGQLDEQGVFQSNVLMTKCASKYSGDHIERLENKS
ncbi:MAG: cytochrome c maturation protein CcmE [Phycisphaeraceae bacterium]